MDKNINFYKKKSSIPWWIERSEEAVIRGSNITLFVLFVLSKCILF